MRMSVMKKWMTFSKLAYSRPDRLFGDRHKIRVASAKSGGTQSRSGVPDLERGGRSAARVASDAGALAPGGERPPLHQARPRQAFARGLSRDRSRYLDFKAQLRINVGVPVSRVTAHVPEREHSTANPAPTAQKFPIGNFMSLQLQPRLPPFPRIAAAMVEPTRWLRSCTGSSARCA